MLCCQKPSVRPRFPSGVIIGLATICLGVAFVFHNLRLIYIEDVLQFLPCIVIALGIARLWNRGFFSVWGHILVMGGMLLQILALQIWAHNNDMPIGKWCDVEMLWPVLVIWVGIIVLAKGVLPKKEKPSVGKGAETAQANPNQEHHWHRRVGEVEINGVSDIDAMPAPHEAESAEAMPIDVEPDGTEPASGEEEKCTTLT